MEMSWGIDCRDVDRNFCNDEEQRVKTKRWRRGASRFPPRVGLFFFNILRPSPINQTKPRQFLMRSKAFDFVFGFVATQKPKKRKTEILRGLIKCFDWENIFAYVDRLKTHYLFLLVWSRLLLLM